MLVYKYQVKQNSTGFSSDVLQERSTGVPGVRNISGNMVLFPCSRFHTLSLSSYMNEFSASCITVEVTSSMREKASAMTFF
jgi:hypothetical protein